jgi:hypothetical protein
MVVRKLQWQQRRVPILGIELTTFRWQFTNSVKMPAVLTTLPHKQCLKSLFHWHSAGEHLLDQLQTLAFRSLNPNNTHSCHIMTCIFEVRKITLAIQRCTLTGTWSRHQSCYYPVVLTTLPKWQMSTKVISLIEWRLVNKLNSLLNRHWYR